MPTEKEEFLARTRKLPQGCLEFCKPDGSSYPESYSPTWKKGEAVRHAAVRLLGSFLGKLGKQDRVYRSSFCITKWCVHPAHLTVHNVNSSEEANTTPLSKPPGFIIGEGPSPVYVQDRRVYPMLIEEEDLPPKKKINRPGFAGRH
jgi:hypothetical protein